MSTLRQSGVVPLALERDSDAAAFRTYVEQALAPQLRAGDRVLWDNLLFIKCGYPRALSYNPPVPRRMVTGFEKMYPIPSRPTHLPTDGGRLSSSDIGEGSVSSPGGLSRTTFLSP
jgi:hypothetical protein